MEFTLTIGQPRKGRRNVATGAAQFGEAGRSATRGKDAAGRSAPVGAAGASADSEFLCPCRGKLHPTRVPRVPRRSASPTVAPPVATFLRPSGADPRRSHTRSEIAALRHRIRRNENCRQVRIFNRLRPVHSEKAGRQRVPADAGATQESRNASFCPRGTVRAASPKTFRCPKKFRELSAVIARLLGNDDVRRREQTVCG